MTKINETALRAVAHPAAAAAVPPLVLNDLIADASAKLTVTVAAETAASAALALAETALVGSQLAADVAAHQPGANVLQAELDLEDAARKARVANRVATASVHNREAAREAVIEAKVAAHAPVMAEGARRMVAAAQAIEDAQAALHAGFLAYRTGERMTHLAIQAGRGGDNNVQWLVDSENEICAPKTAVELAKWVRLGVLPAVVEG